MYYMINWLKKIRFSVLLLVMSVSPAYPFAEISVYSTYSHQEIDGGFFASTTKSGPGIPIEGFVGMIVYADPPLGCTTVKRPPVFKNPTRRWILLVSRGDCTFEKKIRNAQDARYNMVIVHNNSSRLEPMYIANITDINVPSVLVDDKTGLKFKFDYQYFNSVYITVDDNPDFPFDINADLLIPFAVVVSVCTITMITLMVCKCIRDRRRARRYRLPASSLKKIPTEKFSKGSPYETCAICLEDYVDGEKLRILPCSHAYHSKCIDPWLTKRRRVCPICKRKVFAADETPTNDTESDSDTDNDERTPLVRTEPVSQQPAGPNILARERLLTRLRIAQAIRRTQDHNYPTGIAGTSASNIENETYNRYEPLPSNYHPARVVNSINSADNDSIIDMSPSSSVYSFNGSISQTRHSTNSQGSLDNGTDNGSENLSSVVA